MIFCPYRKKNCRNCCSRWWINIDGSPCSNYEPIETSISSTTAVDIFAPTTLTGICFESGDLPLSTGAHQISLVVGNCPGSPFTNAASGLYSTSRLIVEEIPRRKSCHIMPKINLLTLWAHQYSFAKRFLVHNWSINIIILLDLLCTISSTLGY